VEPARQPASRSKPPHARSRRSDRQSCRRSQRHPTRSTIVARETGQANASARRPADHARTGTSAPSRHRDGAGGGRRGDSFRDSAIAPSGAGARVLAVESDHPTIRGAAIAFLTERSCQRCAWIRLLGKARAVARTREPGATPLPSRVCSSESRRPREVKAAVTGRRPSRRRRSTAGALGLPRCTTPSDRQRGPSCPTPAARSQSGEVDIVTAFLSERHWLTANARSRSPWCDRRCVAKHGGGSCGQLQIRRPVRLS